MGISKSTPLVIVKMLESTAPFTKGKVYGMPAKKANVLAQLRKPAVKILTLEEAAAYKAELDGTSVEEARAEYEKNPQFVWSKLPKVQQKSVVLTKRSQGLNDDGTPIVKPAPDDDAEGSVDSEDADDEDAVVEESDEEPDAEDTDEGEEAAADLKARLQALAKEAGIKRYHVKGVERLQDELTELGIKF